MKYTLDFDQWRRSTSAFYRKLSPKRDDFCYFRNDATILDPRDPDFRVQRQFKCRCSNCLSHCAIYENEYLVAFLQLIKWRYLICCRLYWKTHFLLFLLCFTLWRLFLVNNTSSVRIGGKSGPIHISLTSDSLLQQIFIHPLCSYHSCGIRV